MTDNPHLTPQRQPDDADAALRPKTLAEFVGQAAAKGNLRVFIESAKSRGQAMDHVLFFGPPGLGKTTLAQIVARELGVVLPVSFFERAGQAFFNSVAMVDADGRVLGVYRKSHIPQGPGYEEKFYFSPGDTGFRVWETAVGRVGVGICWDQWFPESARSMALLGAEVLLYPTAIGSEPPNPAYDSQPHWEMTQRGHAAANVMPLVASNRIGREVAPEGRDVTFYGSSFIAGPSGDLLAKASRDGEEVLTATVDLDEIAALRRSWGVFRDRRPDLYTPLRGLDGLSA